MMNVVLSSPNAEAKPLLADSVIAIDGPAGSGKSTCAQALAAKLGLTYIDTGAMYRALAWSALHAGVPPSAEGELIAILREARIELKPGKRQTTVLWNGQDVSAAIRTPEVDQVVSEVSAHAAVRREMVNRQRVLGRTAGVVMEGRDIGSVVFPLATVKIYLDASLAARVERRFRQYRQAGQVMTRQQLEAELAARDRQDSQRQESPLAISPDAIVLDTSAWSLPEQIDQVTQAVMNTLAERRRTVEAARTPDPILPKYAMAYHVFQALARFYGLRTIWLEGASLSKGCIVACNHISWWDPPIVGATLQRCRVHTLAKAELFRFPPAGAFFRFLDSIPIQRTGYDNRAFNQAIAALKAGNNLFIFPEGTRRPIGQPGPVRNGLGILVQKTNAPVQTIFVRGTCHLEPGGSNLSPLEVWYAPLVRMHALQVLAERHDYRSINRQVAQLCEAIYRELQARSYAENPPTDWELSASVSQEKSLRAKSERLFGPKGPVAGEGWEEQATD